MNSHKFNSNENDNKIQLISNKTIFQEYKISLERSSNITSNVLLEKALFNHSEVMTKNTVNDILHLANQLTPAVNRCKFQTWKSSPNTFTNANSLLEKSLPVCPKCISIEYNLNDFANSTCRCDLRLINDTEKNISTPQPEENYNGESNVNRLFKPKFARNPSNKNMMENCMTNNRDGTDTYKDLYDETENDTRSRKGLVAKIAFKTAKEQLLGSNPAAKRTLGASRKAQGRFVSPMLGAQEKQDISEPVIMDDRLKHVDPKMVELIESEIIDKGTPIGWDDVAGLEMAKSVIQEAVVWPLLRPDIFTGLRRPPKGILLFGPPGTGKTLIGKCVAAQCNATFFSISASSLTSKWIGDGEKMVRALFAVARCRQPAVIFIDEIDSLLTQRSDGEHEATRRIKTEFLVQFDGAAIGEEDRVLIVGATNRPQELDEAARRRLVKRLYIPLPDLNARRQMVENLLRNEDHQISNSDVNEIANLTDGFSGADMKSLCSEAAMGPIRSVPLSQIVSIDRDKVRPMNAQDFKTALQRVRPSVSQDDLTQYVKWNATYGHGL